MPPEPLLDREFIQQVEKLRLVSRKAVSGRLRGERRSKKRGSSNEFADYRDYVPGDDLRYLDWNIYGRLDRLFVKLFHEEEDLTVSILIDCSKSMASGEPQKLRYALQVAAALSYVALSGEDRVGIYPFDGKMRGAFRPCRGRRKLPALLKYLEDLQAHEGEGTSFDKALKTFAAQRRGRGLVILISDFLDPHGYQESLKHVSGQHSESFAIQLLSPEEIDPPAFGDLRLLDSETSEEVLVSVNQKLLDAYQNTVQSFIAGVRQACSKRNIQPLFSSTSTPFDQLVLSYLRSRGLLQ